MPHFSREMPSGRFASVVKVTVRATADQALYVNTITVLSDAPRPMLDIEMEAMTIMHDQIAVEGHWGVVIGAHVLPADGAEAQAVVNA